MARQHTVKTLREALETVVKLIDKGDTDGAMEIASDVLAPKSNVSSFEQRVKDVTEYIVRNMSLVMASNEFVADKLTSAGIMSPAGRPWTRSNISRTMTVVRKNISAMIDSGKIKIVVGEEDTSSFKEKYGPAVAELSKKLDEVDVINELEDLEELEELHAPMTAA